MKPPYWQRSVVVGAMLETIAFFEKQVERCNLLAEQASNQSEQEFWLRSACRWEAILRIKGAKGRQLAKPSDFSGQLPSSLAGVDQELPAPGGGAI